MPSPGLILCLLFVGCFGLAARVELWRQNWSGNHAQSSSFLTVLLGDSRRLFANHFFEKADVYFHSGYYPTVFDKPLHETPHLAGEAMGQTPPHFEEHRSDAPHQEHGEEGNFLGQPRDWIDGFGRHFFPSRHSHLEKLGEEREILPWLRLSAELDPQRVETYVVAAFWLRTRLGRVDEAERFLRDGWSANRDSYEILFELGRVFDENHQDAARARNVWELALQKWNQRESGKAQPDGLAYLQITGHLARLEERQGNLAKAVSYLEMFQRLAPHPTAVQEQIDELKEKMVEAKTSANRSN